MNKQREKEIETEVERRLKLWIKHSTFEEMCVCDSFIHFHINLALIGYPLEGKPVWMIKENFERFVTDKEFDSAKCDAIVEGIFLRERSK